jgi:hypothetical protein
LEGGFLKELERHPQTNQVQKVVLPPVDGSQPSIAYLRMPVWRAHQVQALTPIFHRFEQKSSEAF